MLQQYVSAFVIVVKAILFVVGAAAVYNYVFALIAEWFSKLAAVSRRIR